jgi:predicted TPR repeat methyltransferase
MPYSDARFDETVKSILKKIQPKKILDVGPGHGKYSRLIRSVLNEVHIEAVEIEKSYIKEFKLKELYDELHNCSIQEFVDNNIDTAYDLVIFGDVIEHLKKSEGIDVLNFFVYRTKHVMVQWPHGFIQNSWEGHQHEAHIAVWGKADFSNFDYKWYQKDYMRLALVKGYITE